MKTRILSVVAACAAFVSSAAPTALETRIAEKHKILVSDRWGGGHRMIFEFEGRKGWVIEPSTPRADKPWCWTMQWMGAFLKRTNAPKLVENGYYHTHLEAFDTKCDETGLKALASFQKYLVTELGFAPKAYLIGMSWGGFYSIRYAATYPDNVAAVYLDAPLLDFEKFSKTGPGPWAQKPPKDGNWSTDPRMPVNMAATVAKAGIPVLLLYGGQDQVVDPKTNAELFAKRFKEAGGVIAVDKRGGYGHHPHGVELNDDRIVRFFGGERPPLPKLGYSKEKFEKGTGVVAFIGGSITEMNGYRPLMMASLKRRFPKCAFTFTDAGVSSTCSTAGAFRFDEDVLQKGVPDLLFAEFAVNDDQDSHASYQQAVKGFEGLVRHARRVNPKMDIVPILFTNKAQFDMVCSGGVPVQYKAHQAVADRYGLPCVNVAEALYNAERAGHFSWTAYRDCHPSPEGCKFVAKLLDDVLDAEWSKPGKPNAGALPAALEAGSYEDAKWLDLKTVVCGKGWEVSRPDWETLKYCRAHFMKGACLWSVTPGAVAEVPFTGDVLAAFVLAGADAGKLDVSVDGGDWKTIDLYRGFTTLHYPYACVLAEGLPAGAHKAKLRVSAEKAARSTGTAVRLFRVGAATTPGAVISPASISAAK